MSPPPTSGPPPHGVLLFADDFTRPAFWTVGQSPAGLVALGKAELSLAVTQPRGYLYSLRQETLLGDFYAEITAAPNLCRGSDEYGLLIRYAGPQDFLRFGLTCRGEVRLERLVGGRASLPKPPSLSGAAPAAAPSSVRLAVWAQGREVRFYINEEWQFTVNEPQLLVGGLGVYARAAGDQEVTVTFSQLLVYQVGR